MPCSKGLLAVCAHLLAQEGRLDLYGRRVLPDSAGAGGQLAVADRDHGAAFASLGHQMGGYGDARARELARALRHALDA